VGQSWVSMEAAGSKVISLLFFQRLSSIAREVRERNMFLTAGESNELLERLQFLIGTYNGYTEKLSIREQRFGRSGMLKRNQYAIVGNALLQTLAETLGDGWNEEVEEAWTAYYGVVAEEIINGAVCAMA
jgi:hemoglobin-like flavoprotein